MLLTRHRLSIATSLALSLSLTSIVQADMYYGYHIDTGGYYQTSSNSFGLVDAFLPTWQNEANVLFVDARGVDHQGPEIEGNIGLGYRHLFGDDHWLWGTYAAYDVEKSSELNIFHQAILGGELKTTHWVSDINAFVPFGDTIKAAPSLNESYFASAGTPDFYYLFVSVGKEEAMPGMDAEWGYRFLPDFIGYVGGYYYGATGVKPITGPRARLTYDWNNPLNATGIWKELINRITFETAVQHDSQAQTQWYIGLRLRVGLGSQPSDASDNPVIRDMTAYVNRGENVGNGLDVATGRVDTGFNVVTNGGLSNPNDTALPNDPVLPAVFFFPSSAEHFNNTTLRNQASYIVITQNLTGITPFTLLSNQYLTGGSFTVTYLGTTYTVNQGLAKPTLTEDTGVALQAAGNAFATVAQGNTINSLVLAVNNVNTTDAIVNTGAYGATGESVGDLTVNNVNTNSRLYFNIGDASHTSSINLTDDNVTLSRSGASNAIIGGIDFTTGNASALIADIEGGSVTTTGNYAAGILNGSGSTLTVIKGMTLTSSNSDVIENTGTIQNLGETNAGNTLTASGNSSRGIYNTSVINNIIDNNIQANQAAIKNDNGGHIDTIASNTLVSTSATADAIDNSRTSTSTIGTIGGDTAALGNNITADLSDIANMGAGVITIVRHNIMHATTSNGFYNQGTISTIRDNTITTALSDAIFSTGAINAITSNTIDAYDVGIQSNAGTINAITANTIQAGVTGIDIEGGTVGVIGGYNATLGNTITVNSTTNSATTGIRNGGQINIIQYNSINVNANGSIQVDGGIYNSNSNATIGVSGNSTTGILNNTIEIEKGNYAIRQDNVSSNHLYGTITNNTITTATGGTSGIYLAKTGPTVVGNTCNGGACTGSFF